MKKDYFLIISVVLFTVCLPLTAITVFSNSVAHNVNYPSWYIIIMGSISFMFNFSQGVIWLANPLHFLSIFLLKRGNSKSIYVSIMATLLAISFLSFTKITVTGSGRTERIISLNLGYWIWILSLSTLTVGLIISKVRKQ